MTKAGEPEQNSNGRFRKTRLSLLRIDVVLLLIIVLIVGSIPFFLLQSRSSFPAGGGGPRNGLSPGPIYDSIASLKGNSTTVALVSVAKVNATYCAITPGGLDCNLLDTVFQVNVISYLKGSGPQNVYVADGPFPGNPILIVGNEYVLFLLNKWDCAPAPDLPCTLPPTPLSVTYYAQGGPQGKFLVQSGLVYGFKTLYPQLNDWVKVDASAVPLNQFTAEVQSA